MAFKTRMVWRSVGAGHWQYVLELQQEGEQLLKPAGRRNRLMRVGSHSLGEFPLNVVRIECGAARRPTAD